MRTDVKLGVVISMVVVFVAGGYFVFRGEEAKPVNLAETATSPTTAPQTADANNARRNPATLPNRNARQPANRPIVPQNQPAPTGASSAVEFAQNTRAADSTPPSNVPAPGANNPVNPAVTQPAPTPTDSATNPAGGGAQPANPAPANAGNPTAPASAVEALAAMRRSAPPETTPTTKPATAAVDIHRAQPGDTLASLAQKYYGSTKYASVLKQANPEIKDPSSIRVGTAVRVPPLPADAETLADAAPSRTAGPAPAGNSAAKPAGGSRTYVVRPGDSFYKIAEKELGKASRWKELLALNKSLVDGDPTRLRVGQKVVLPES